jgi:iron complex outermembrane receptor protein
MAADAQTGNISGTVTESARNSNLSGVSIRVEGQTIETVTDDSGRYLLQGVRTGTVKISAAYLGLETTTEAITVVANSTVTWSPALKIPSQSYSVTVSE